MKKLLSVLLASTMALTAMGGLAACGGEDDKNTIKIWAPAASIAGYRDLVAQFKEENPDYASWNFKFENKEEGDVQGSMSDPRAGADIFFFPSDHFGNFAFNLKCLQPLTATYETQVTARDSEASIEFVTKTVEGEEKIYAFPATDDNGYFLWYDSTKLKAGDIDTWDHLIAAAKRENKKVLFNYGNSYYTAAFYFGTGTYFDYEDDMMTTYRTNVDGQPGKLATQAYLKYFSSSYMGSGNNQVVLASDPDSALATGFEAGTLVAGVGGTWVKKSIQEAMGTGYNDIKTAILPDFSVGSTNYHMQSFIGSKYCGVNSTKSTDRIEVSLAFANFLTGQKGQQARYDSTGAGPTNKVVAATNEVQTDPVLITYRAQKAEGHGYLQKDQPTEFWDGLSNMIKKIPAGTLTQTNYEEELTTIANSLRGN